MTTILPRWEWRTFGTTFGDAEARIRMYPSQILTSRGTYIVSGRSDAETRICNLILDIKVLQETNRDGLERWYPVTKEPFPVRAAVVAEACRRWHLDAPPLRRESYSADEFLDEIVAERPGLQTVHVRKQAHRFTIDDCLVEIAEVTFDGAPLRTVAVEMPEAAQLMSTVRRLGLARFENVSYVKALRRFLESKPVQAR
jgi:exopolyphosphatase/guanosine-5'-triphosphate,3'-diphosphate pyrophosphatase